MKYFLTGGGDQEYFRDLDRRFLNELPLHSTVLILPMACEREDYLDVYDRISSEFSSRKITHFDLCEDINKINYQKLCEYDALIFEGGNTFKLINELRESRFFKFLQDYCQLNKCIYADSAGAIVLGSDVQTAFMGDDADEDEHKLQDYRGLGLLKEWSMHCHFSIDERDQIQELIYSTGSSVLCLPEETGVLLDTNITPESIEIFGELPATIVGFAGISKLSPGSIHYTDH